MSENKWLWSTLVAIVLLVLPGARQAKAQEVDASLADQAAEAPVQDEGVSDLDDIDEILQAEESGQGGGYAYDPGGRRDPFKSLQVLADKRAVVGPRPEGVPGLLIDEITVSGIFKTRDGFVAQVQAAEKQKSYLIKVGDQLFDGDVIEITKYEVIFKQNVQDPTALKPFREVTKSLKSQ